MRNIVRTSICLAIAALPAAAADVGPVPFSAMNRPNGPAQLDAQGRVSLQTVMPTGASQARSLGDRAGDALSILDFAPAPACDGVTDDSAAISAAMASGRRISIPDGRICYGRTISQAGITAVFVGPGQLRTSDGNLRGPIVSQISQAPVRVGPANIVEGFNGDLSRVPLSIEHRIGGDALGRPATGYAFMNETSAVYIHSFNSSGWNNATGTASGAAGRTGYGVMSVDMTHVGQGDGSIYFGSGFVTGVKAGATSFLANGAGALLTGAIAAGANGVYLQGVGDLNLIDNGYDVAAIGSTINLMRQNGTGQLGTTWIGYRVQSGGSAAPDAAFSASGAYKMVVDAVDAQGTAAAVAMAAGQKIFGNATQPNATPFPSTVLLGTESVGYTVGSGWEVVGTDGLTVRTPAGAVLLRVRGDGAVILPLGTPASGSASCTAGQRLADSSYEYVCVATNTWKRAALSSF